MPDVPFLIDTLLFHISFFILAFLAYALISRIHSINKLFKQKF